MTNNDDDFVAQVLAESEKRHQEQLASARAIAVARGKEPFDLEKLEAMCDTSHEGRLAPRDERHAEFERKYYVQYPDVMTLAELAEKIDELSRW